MRYWWFNYGESSDEHIGQGFLALPVRDSVGVSKASWGRLKDVEPGDIVFGFEDGALDYLLVADDSPERGKIDNESGKSYQAIILPVAPLELPVQIERARFESDIAGFFDEDGTPWEGDPNRYGDIHALPAEVGTHLLKLVDDLEGGLGVGIAGDAVMQALFINGVPERELDTLDEARAGQGAYRELVLSEQGARCCFTGLSSPELLLVQQIKFWLPASREERLDPLNALVLAPTLAAAFVQGLISVDDDGACLVSDLLDPGDAQRMGLAPAPKLTFRGDRQRSYAAWHRAEVFRS